jgi:hypothetical protein
MDTYLLITHLVISFAFPKEECLPYNFTVVYVVDVVKGTLQHCLTTYLFKLNIKNITKKIQLGIEFQNTLMYT